MQAVEVCHSEPAIWRARALHDPHQVLCITIIVWAYLLMNINNFISQVLPEIPCPCILTGSYRDDIIRASVLSMRYKTKIVYRAQGRERELVQDRFARSFCMRDSIFEWKPFVLITESTPVLQWSRWNGCFYDLCRCTLNIIVQYVT